MGGFFVHSSGQESGRRGSYSLFGRESGRWGKMGEGSSFFGEKIPTPPLFFCPIFDPFFGAENRRWRRIILSSAPKIKNRRWRGSSIFGSEDRKWMKVLRSSSPKNKDGGRSSIFGSEDRRLKMGGCSSIFGSEDRSNGFFHLRLQRTKMEGILRRRGGLFEEGKGSSKKRGASSTKRGKGSSKRGGSSKKRGAAVLRRRIGVLRRTGVFEEFEEEGVFEEEKRGFFEDECVFRSRAENYSKKRVEEWKERFFEDSESSSNKRVLRSSGFFDEGKMEFFVLGKWRGGNTVAGNLEHEPCHCLSPPTHTAIQSCTLP